ncbi:hypothetical protein AMTRI_Chr09g33230 [Amborella trichopoda]|uniref:4-coumarate--CoA ligase n=1 Tax=Amborella trichopoda TaxID=13333 RepID=U5D3P4_AMBTC|nr:benzoate--CoA ligase, peroxisomal [Amborella trichopoda]ERN17039.1 hypothetical protein AMTR_s00044p00031990 [Amborella trichopoda]|eukprot:XP_006855572.1 benzoate--CoA ligase, peroxisomal [Amborella trichopoda]
MEILGKNQANHAPLTPVSFLERAGAVYSKRISIVYGRVRYTWEQTRERCRRLASSLRHFNIEKNDVVSVLAPNIPAMYELHFSVPMAGAVLNTINIRLDANTVATILRLSGAKLLFVDYQFFALAQAALNLLCGDSSGSHSAYPLTVIFIDDADQPSTMRPQHVEYEQLVEAGDPTYMPPPVADEWDPISLNYTSGTTSAPKGVVYSHRGAYLSTLSLLLQWEVGNEAVYLWSLPMFHCNGWTFTWGIAARGGTNVCMRNTTAPDIYRAISEHGVTHMCAAPIIFNLLLNPADEHRLKKPVRILTGGAPPPASLLDQIERLGFHITHAYGMTEATGPALVCEWLSEWDRLPSKERSQIKARQGISVLSLADADVVNPETMQSVRHDGHTMGEIILRGSSVMKGYFKDPKATTEAFKGGWFHTGDMAVIHPDGYVEIKDRLKDVIISGGENISSVEVESVLYRHPKIAEVAVVAMPNHHWGESPCAFVSLKKGSKDLSEEELISFCRTKMAGYKLPKKVVFLGELPKTGTGKIRKFQLREWAKDFATHNPSHPNLKRTPSLNNQPSSSVKDHQYVDHQVMARSRL